MLIKQANLQDLNSPLLDLYRKNLNFHHQARPDYFISGENDFCTLSLQQFIEKKSVLIIEDDTQKIVGFAIYTFKNEGKPIIWIKSLYIDEKERNKGYGKALIEEIKKIGRENHCQNIELNCRGFNQNALAMYQHIGMKVQKVIFETDLNEG